MIHLPLKQPVILNSTKTAFCFPAVSIITPACPDTGFNGMQVIFKAISRYGVRHTAYHLPQMKARPNNLGLFIPYALIHSSFANSVFDQGRRNIY